MRLIYVASPYSGDYWSDFWSSQTPKERTKATEKEQLIRANVVAKKIANMMIDYPDNFFYSPVVHFRQVALHNDYPHDNEFWWKYNLAMLEVFHEVWVLRMNGWELSEGLNKEIDFAFDKGMPVKFVQVPEEFNIRLMY